MKAHEDHQLVFIFVSLRSDAPTYKGQASEQ